jgi:hypothetical protein
VRVSSRDHPYHKCNDADKAILCPELTIILIPQYISAKRGRVITTRVSPITQGIIAGIDNKGEEVGKRRFQRPAIREARPRIEEEANDYQQRAWKSHVIMKIVPNTISNTLKMIDKKVSECHEYFIHCSSDPISGRVSRSTGCVYYTPFLACCCHTVPHSRFAVGNRQSNPECNVDEETEAPE